MHFCTLCLATAFTLAVSFILVYRVAVLDKNFRRLQRDISLSFRKPKPEDLKTGLISGTAASVQSARVDFRGMKWKEGQQACRSLSFMQLSANADKLPFVKENVTVIPWTVAVQRGAALSSEGHKILVQEDGFYMVYGQVLFHSPETIMGHIVRSRGSGGSDGRQGSTELLRCLQEMPQTNSVNTCYTAGIVQLDRRDELELVIPDRPHAQVSMDGESTFFGIIQLT